MIGSIENAILARAAAAAKAGVLGYHYRAAKALPIDSSADDLAKDVKSFPALWVVYAGWDPLAEMGNDQTKVRMTFAVLVGAENLRNPNASRQGAGDKVGSYQMAIDIAGLMVGQDLGLAIGGFVLGAMKPVLSRDQLSIFSVTLTTDVVIDPLGTDLGMPAIGDFETFNVNWDVQPFDLAADPDAALPIATTRDDLTTTQTLPIEEPA